MLTPDEFLPPLCLWRECLLSRTGRSVLTWAAVLLLLVALPAGSVSQDDSEDDSGFDQLVEKFEFERNNEPYERLQTIVDFGAIISPNVVPFLTELFGEEDNPAIAGAIVRALGMQRSLPAVRFIVAKGIPKLLGDFANFPAVGKALRNRFDAKIEKWLLKNLLTPGVRRDADALAMALEVLAELGIPSRFKVLAKELKATSDSRTQVAILRAFREYRPKNAAKVASKYLKAPVKTVQMMALEVMHSLKNKSRKSTYVKLLKSPYPEVRILAIDLLALSGDKKLIKLLSPLLKKKDVIVRIAAVQALARTVRAEAVEALIQAVDANDGRVRDDIIDALIRLTGEDVGASGVQWESWWAVKKDTVDLRWRSPKEFEIVRSKKQSKDKKTVTYYGLRVLSNKVTFVIDFSESMGESYQEAPDADASGEAKKKVSENAESPFESLPASTRFNEDEDEDEDEDESKAEKKKKKKKRKKTVEAAGPTKISVAKAELRSVIKSLRNDVLINVVGFETFVTPWRPKMQKLTAETRSEIEEFIEKGNPSGMTNVYGSLEMAFKDSRVDTIYFLSDGAPTHGRHIKPEDILHAVSDLNRYRKVRINTIGFGLKAEEETLMQDLADQNFGVFMRR